MNLTQEGGQMFSVAKGLRPGVESVAKEMIASKTAIAPLLAPNGRPLLYVSTDRSKLRLAFMEISVEGTSVFVGMRAKEQS